MGTRSYICMTDGNMVKKIYCHYDGYISYNGVLLYLGYNDVNKVNQLINKGYISSLGYNLELPKEFKEFKDYMNMSVYHTESCIHTLTTFCTPMRVPHPTFDVLAYNKLYLLLDDIMIAFIYLFDTRDNTWYLYLKNKNAEESKYNLGLLLTNKEYYYKFVKETGQDMDNWITVKKAYIFTLKDINGDVSILQAYNGELRRLFNGKSPYKIVAEGDYYVLYEKGNQKPVMKGYIVDLVHMVRKKHDLVYVFN